MTVQKRISKILMLVALVAVAALLGGCGASLTVYDYIALDGSRVNEYELTIDSRTVAAMEASAATDENGKKYTVADYYYALFSDCGYELVSAARTDTAYTARYRKTFSDNVTTELERYGTTIDYITKRADNPFVATIDRKSPNPFNGVRAAYDAVEPNQSGTLMQQLKNGKIAVDEYGVRIVIFPSMQDAFPYLKGIDPDGLMLNYAVAASRRSQSNGRAYKIDSDTSRFVFSRYFDRSETSIEFEYTRPVVYGWYLVAAAVGVIAVAVIYLVTRAKKEKPPTLLERFPYDPEEYRGYEPRLPMNK